MTHRIDQAVGLDVVELGELHDVVLALTYFVLLPLLGVIAAVTS